MKAKLLRLAALSGALASSAGAFAQSTGAVDVTSTVSTISAQLTPIAAVGGAVLGVIVAIKAYKWVRRAM
jgi:hypothetical protein